MDRKKQQAPANIFRISDTPAFQIQIANGQLAKPIATATLELDIRENTYAEHFLIMKNLTWRFIGLHFMSYNSVVIDTTHDLIHFPQLKMPVKSTSNETSAEPQVVLIHDSIRVPPMTTKTITAFVDHSLV